MPQERTAVAADHQTHSSPTTRTMTFLFTDMEGSTALLQRAGHAYESLLEDHRRLLRAAFSAHDGREIDTQGDSFFVVFADPKEAVAAAAGGQRALAEHEWLAPFAVRVRMGLHSGAAREAGESYVGLAVHRGARIAAAAHGGQVLLSDATAALVQDDLPYGGRLRDLGEHRLKDFPTAAHLYQLDLPGLPTVFPPPRCAPRRSRLPRLPSTFVGRETEVEAVARLLRDDHVHLLTLTGPGGVGKTRLALEAGRAVAADLPGGVVFVALTGVVDSTLVMGAIADALHVRREPGDDVLAAVATALGDDRTLLILDNFEQVLGAAGDIAELLYRVPAAVVLVTSRHVLRLRSEQQILVPQLAEPSAVQLFVDRAAAVQRGFPSDEADMLVVAEICRRLDGVPLAIELAAARIRLLTPRALLTRLGEQFDLLSQGPVDLPERQRSLRATMDWSHDLLAPYEQALFARLAVFAGGWDLDAAERVCRRKGDPEVLDTLMGLLDASLIIASHVGPEPRFSMLEAVRTYAGEHLTNLADRIEIERRHTAWVVALTDELLRANGQDYRLAGTRLDCERANLRSAVQRAIETRDVATAALLIRNTVGYMQQRDAQLEFASWVNQALTQAKESAPAVRGRLLVLRAAGVPLNDLAGMPALLAEAEPLLPDEPDYEVDRAMAAIAAIQVGWEQGPEQALRAVETASARFGRSGWNWGRLTCIRLRGTCISRWAMRSEPRTPIGSPFVSHRAWVTTR